MNNEMDDFSIKTGSPNIYGLIGGKVNSVQPQKRMLSSMTPTIIEKDGKLSMILGSLVALQSLHQFYKQF